MSGKSIIGENKGKKGIGGQIASFFKKETVLCLAAAVAGVSMFFVPPGISGFSGTGIAVLPDAGGCRAPERGPFPLSGLSASGWYAKHKTAESAVGSAVLFQQHDHHQ